MITTVLQQVSGKAPSLLRRNIHLSAALKGRLFETRIYERAAGAVVTVSAARRNGGPWFYTFSKRV